MTDRFDLSEDALSLLRIHFGGGKLRISGRNPESLPGRSVEDTRSAYRELVQASLMYPVSTFAGGAEALHRLTEQAAEHREELLSRTPVVSHDSQ